MTAPMQDQLHQYGMHPENPIPPIGTEREALRERHLTRRGGPGPPQLRTPQLCEATCKRQHLAPSPSIMPNYRHSLVGLGRLFSHSGLDLTGDLEYGQNPTRQPREKVFPLLG
jgi:hypothetical protein